MFMVICLFTYSIYFCPNFLKYKVHDPSNACPIVLLVLCQLEFLY